MGTLSNSEDPDEIHCLLILKQGTEIQYTVISCLFVV